MEHYHEILMFLGCIAGYFILLIMLFEIPELLEKRNIRVKHVFKKRYMREAISGKLLEISCINDVEIKIGKNISNQELAEKLNEAALKLIEERNQKQEQDMEASTEETKK